MLSLQQKQGLEIQERAALHLQLKEKGICLQKAGREGTRHEQ